MTKSKRKPPKPIPLSVLTGFLGSGKTTLLNWVLGHELFSNSIVIINEFGDVGLDHLFVETAEEQMIEMSSGCLCCTIRGDLCATLEQLLRGRDNNRINEFDRVIIETTGLADPAPIVQTLITHPYLSKRFRMNGLITTIDAQYGASTLEAMEEAVKQVAMADALVVTKSDIVDVTEADIARLHEKLNKLNKTAPRVMPEDQALCDAFLSENAYKPDKNHPDIMQWLEGAAEGEHRHDHGHHHHHDHDHHHDHEHHNVNIHNERISSFSFSHHGAISEKQYGLFLEVLRAHFGVQLLRFKALVKIKEHVDQPLVSHGVQHVFYPSVKLDHWPVDDRNTRIVCITDGVEEDKIASLFKSFAQENNVWEHSA